MYVIVLAPAALTQRRLATRESGVINVNMDHVAKIAPVWSIARQETIPIANYAGTVNLLLVLLRDAHLNVRNGIVLVDAKMETKRRALTAETAFSAVLRSAVTAQRSFV